MDIRNNQNQYAEKHHNLNSVIDKELNTAAYLFVDIKPAKGEQIADQSVEPFHTEYFILNKSPHKHLEI